MSTLADLRPGDIMFARHVSPKAADLLILAGQTFLGEPGYPHHVAVVSRAATDRSWPMVVQAMPSGAEEVPIGAEHWTQDYIYVRPAYRSLGQVLDVADEARSYVGTPYSFLDYVALTGLHLGIRNGPIRRYVTTSKHMICSQLADQAMSDAGWHVFNDGRLPQDVTPAALFKQMFTMPGATLIPGEGDWVDNGAFRAS
jgi:uncharacterized protein YycO